MPPADPAPQEAAARPHRDGLEGARSAAATIRSVYSEACLVAEASVLRGRRPGNVVIFGRGQPLPEAALARAVAGDPFPARVVAGADLARFAAGARVVTDAAVAGHPAAPAEAAPSASRSPR